MANPILHISDSYFFEIPKFIYRPLFGPHYDKMSEVPKFLLNDPAAKGMGLKEINKELEGKVLIWQPFGGQLKNLYQKESGFCVSRFMVLELVVALFLIVACIRQARRAQSGDRPRGKRWNFLEALLIFLREEVAKPAIGDHEADKYVPLLWTMFLFILACNLLGLIPWLGTPTGAVTTTMALAAVTLLTGMIQGVRHFGPVGYVLHYAPHMDLPIALKIPILPLILLLEIGGTLIRHGVLGIRLLANMAAGHLVLITILGLIVSVAAMGAGLWGSITVLAVVGSALLSCLELFVAFLQAYVFTFLSALFIGQAIHEH